VDRRSLVFLIPLLGFVLVTPMSGVLSRAYAFGPTCQYSSVDYSYPNEVNLGQQFVVSISLPTVCPQANNYHLMARFDVENSISMWSMSRSKIRNIMSAPLIVVDPDATIEQAAKVMAHHKVRRLPVVGKGGLSGIITITDVAKYFSEFPENPNPLLSALARSNNKIYA